MSFNKLVSGDCGGNNPLIQLSNIITRDSMQQSLPEANGFVEEFISQNYQNPQTFNMKSLLHNIPEVEDKDKQRRMLSGQIFDTPQASTSRFPGPSYLSCMPFQHMNMPLYQQQQPLHFNQPSNIQIEYIEECEIGANDKDVQAKAQEYVNTVKDDEIAYNQFMSFMKKISAGELNFRDSVENSHKSKDTIIDEMAEKYKDEWANLSDVSDYWSTEFANGISNEYSFTEGNIMLENKSALEVGKENLKMGDIPGAVLCFEAAVQQQPNSAEAWFLLGSTQAENEQDPLAITALKKSLDIDPRQLEAYITLAAAYTNENMPKFAFIALRDWLSASPKYSDLVPNDINAKALDIKDLENHVKTLYLKAAQLNPTEIDPDIQNGLGVIFNISQEYDKAVDCFRTALMVASDDSKLWNRLGATLANSERSEEAVEAYHHALNLEPGFIRARYNLGITCMNLGAHRQAAEHFLEALNMQYKSKSLHPIQSDKDPSSSSIWTTLRMVCSFMGEPDVAILVDNKNLEELNKFFKIE